MSATLQTADRALQVLLQFRTQAEGLTVTEIAGRLGLHRSTASRLVSTMEARGFLERDAVGKRLRLGPEVARIGRIALAGRELVTVAAPILDELAAETGETVTLAVPAGREVMTVAQADGSYFVSSGKWVGIRTPLHCAADGKVLLAFDGARANGARLTKRTKRTIVDSEALARELRAIRRRGFALAESELEEGLVGLAVPVWDDGSCIAALCVSGPEYRLHRKAARELAPSCVVRAQELARSLGPQADEPPVEAVAAGGGRPPNVVLIMVDQLAAGWLPAYGHPVVQAPNITSLAHEGVVFESAYCASPLCAPSRAALLTGRLPSHTEVFDNAAELRASLPTIAHHLRAAGYATCLAGKMHFVGPDQLHGFEERLTTDVYPADLGWTPDWSLPVGEHLPWYHTMESVLSPGVCAASLQLDYDDEVAFRAVRRIFDFARARYRRARSFWSRPSAIPTTPGRSAAGTGSATSRRRSTGPPCPALAADEADPHSRRLREMIGIDEAALSEEQLRAARHGYYAAISYVDERIGEVLAALRDAGLDGDTVVALTADHGEMLGERGLWYKMSFFEPSARVPLIVSAPGRIAPGRRADPVSLLDLAPTLLELAAPGAADELARDMDGSSLAPLLDDPTAEGPAEVLGEYLAEGVTSPAVMIRRGPHKFIRCDGDPDQLYDLAEDPHELVNLAGRGSHADLHQAFDEAVAARWDMPGLTERVRESQRERRLVTAALAAGRNTPWDYQPLVDASSQYVRGRGSLDQRHRRARLETPR